MNDLIYKCALFVRESSLPFNICAGYALEIFLDKEIRSHSDIDISIFDENKKEFVKFIMNNGWMVYENLRNGLMRLISNPDEQEIHSISALCIKPNCSFVKILHLEDDLYKMEILNKQQLNFDFLEAIFNPKEDGKFIYAQNHAITRDLDKAILYNKEGIPYMAPELVLLCKSVYISKDGNISREGYQKDFDEVTPFLIDERKDWLIDALEILHPNGHKWTDKLKKYK